MKYVNYDVLEVETLDSEGKHVTKLDTLKSSDLVIADEWSSSLEISDALIDFDLLNYVNEGKPSFVKQSRPCQLVLTAVLREDQTGIDKKYQIKIPSAKISPQFQLSAFAYNKDTIDTMPFRWSFTIKDIDRITHGFAE